MKSSLLGSKLSITQGDSILTINVLSSVTSGNSSRKTLSEKTYSPSYLKSSAVTLRELLLESN